MSENASIAIHSVISTVVFLRVVVIIVYGAYPVESIVIS